MGMDKKTGTSAWWVIWSIYMAVSIMMLVLVFKVIT